MEANVVLHMHELIETADIDGIKALMTCMQELVLVRFSPCLRMPPKNWTRMSIALLICRTWNWTVMLTNLFFPSGEQLH